MSLLFTEDDLLRIKNKGISEEHIESQLENFRKGFPPINLVAPATVGRGIIKLKKEACNCHVENYQAVRNNIKTIKFIPASGAASRMFKDLFGYLDQEDQDKRPPEIREIIDGLGKMALEKDLEEVLWQRGLDLGRLLAEGESREIIKALIKESGLNYGQLPKGLIAFHKYETEVRTPLEEHLVEGAEYCRGKGNEVNLHFTISTEHIEPFSELVRNVQSIYEKRLGVSFKIEFSQQRSYTDIIAVDPDNKPFRNQEGDILFRPGGHGALLANLNDLDADLIFVKNIDNVCPDRMKSITYQYKYALAGILVEIRDKVFRFIEALDAGDSEKMEGIEFFLEKQLNMRLSEADKKLAGKEKEALIRRKLNRPIRICGMVKNEGEPGGGPFWTRNRDGSESLQIVESAQIDFDNPDQAEIAGSATHFNPVDLVCSTRDFQGKPFDLDKFTDPATGLISSKSSDGKKLKAQELPGLWNGSMSDWITLFVEVPIETFNPVKTINDLLREEHQA